MKCIFRITACQQETPGVPRLKQTRSCSPSVSHSVWGLITLIRVENVFIFTSYLAGFRSASFPLLLNCGTFLTRQVCSQSIFPSFRSYFALSQIPWWSPTCPATYWGCPAPLPTPPCTVTSTTISTKRSWRLSGRSRTPSTLASRSTFLTLPYFNFLELRSLNFVNLLYRLYYILIYTFLQMRSRNCNLESTEETGFWSENTLIWKL